jgi:hypothetical protein
MTFILCENLVHKSIIKWPFKKKGSLRAGGMAQMVEPSKHNPQYCQKKERKEK